jgi:CDP-glucose 4,6-dehydratase
VKQTLVTGGHGFVASHLARALLARGDTVTVIDSGQPAVSGLALQGIAAEVELIRGDLADLRVPATVIEAGGFDTVFHLAAQTIVGDAMADPVGTLDANVRGTWNVLEACRAAEVPAVVVASSDKAYGAHEALPYREDFALRPSHPYEVSKACADMIARGYAATYGLPVAVTRLANVYGGGDLNFSRIVPDTARALARGERPVIRSDGSPERDYIYVEDAVDAYVAVAGSLDRPELRGRAWNAGSGRPVAVAEVVRLLIAAAGRDVEPDVRGAGAPPGELARQWLDSSAIAAELGWAPRWRLEAGLAETWAWYERHLPQLEPVALGAGRG